MPQRVGTNPNNISSERNPKPQNPVVIRRSLRIRETNSPVKSSSSHTGSLTMREAYSGEGSVKNLIEKLSTSIGGPTEEVNGCKDDFLCDSGMDSKDKQVMKSVDLSSLRLKPNNIARVVPGRILSVRFFPCPNTTMVVAGNKFGNLGFWDVDCTKEEQNRTFLFRPHKAPISAILIPKYSLSKIFTCCYDGFIRLMDAEKEVFDLAYSTVDCIFSLAQKPDDMKCLYFGEGRRGGFNIWDERNGKSISKWILHGDRINSIDFNLENPNLMVTSSTDGRACIWDLRNINADKPLSLKIFKHKGAVHSAYFSPYGSCIATTCADDTIGILRGANYDKTYKIQHFNKTCRFISSFRGIWGWDDSNIFIGNMQKGVDIVSTARRKLVRTLESPLVSAIPCRFDRHPYRTGMLAGATSGDRYIYGHHVR